MGISLFSFALQTTTISPSSLPRLHHYYIFTIDLEGIDLIIPSLAVTINLVTSSLYCTVTNHWCRHSRLTCTKLSTLTLCTFHIQAPQLESPTSDLTESGYDNRYPIRVGKFFKNASQPLSKTFRDLSFTLLPPTTSLRPHTSQ